MTEVPSTPPTPLPEGLRALARSVKETERHVASDGWDGPVRVFALVDPRSALEGSPELADLVDPEDGGLLAVEQEGLPEAETLEDLLMQLAWPPSVDGAAVVVERVVLPPEAEEEALRAAEASGTEPTAELARHPEARDVRMAVGVLRSGESWCAVRARSHDRDEDVLGGVDLVPGLVAAVAATLE